MNSGYTGLINDDFFCGTDGNTFNCCYRL